MSSKFTFLGVSTRNSAVNAVFDDWCHILGVDWTLNPIDLPLNASTNLYHQVLGIYAQPDSVGGLVTTHKAAIYRNCAALFNTLDASARRLEEVGLIRHENGRLTGGVSDVASSGAAFALIRQNIPPSARTAVVLGAGGAGLAFAYRCATDDRMGIDHVVLVENDHARHATVSRLLCGFEMPAGRSITMGVPGANHDTFSTLDSYVLVNATGVGKDQPGDPLASSVDLSGCHGYWDFNYRGDLELLHRIRREHTNIPTFDGWDYFSSGWSVVMSDVAGMQWTPVTKDRFKTVAERIARPA